MILRRRCDRPAAPHACTPDPSGRPDGSGVQACGAAGLSHRRLKIIDLSDAARQPMTNEDRSIWLTYNGEIYNFADIRRELEALGHRFASATDSEVIVHGYEEWGTDCL